MRNYYELLGIEQTNDNKEIKRAYFKKVKEYPPEKNPEEFKEIRQAYELLLDVDKKAEYDELLELPWEISAHLAEAKKLENEGKIKKAIACMEAVNTLASTEVSFQYFLASLYEQVGKFGKAVQVYKKLVELQPENARYWAELGDDQEECSHCLKAIESYERAILLDKDNLFYHIRLADIYFDNNYNEASVETLEGIIDNPEARLYAFYLSIKNYEILGKYDAVRDTIRKASKLIISSNRDIEEIIDFIKGTIQFLSRQKEHHYDKDLPVFRDNLSKLEAKDARQTEAIEELIEYLDLAEFYADERILECFKVLTSLKEEREHLEYELDNYEIALFEAEASIVDDIDLTRKNVILFKKQYPKIYMFNKKFLDLVGNGKKLDKLYDYYNKKLTKLEKEYPKEFGKSANETVVRTTPKIGRNDPCPCGSGKKYKKCCGR